MGIIARHPYDDMGDLVSSETGLDFGVALQPDGKTPQDVQGAHQEYRDECDINFLLRKYDKTGVIPVVQNIEAKYGDFTSATDYHDAHNRILAAQEAFMSLPAKVRSRFDNDPAKLLEFVNDESKRGEAEALGLLAPSDPGHGEKVPVAQVPPVAAPVVSPSGAVVPPPAPKI